MSAILGVLGAALLGMTIILPYFHAQAREMQNVQAAATAREMKQVASAAEKYIQANYAAVEANSTASSPATITVPMLVSTGYLPASSSSENPYGQTWEVQVLQPSAGKLQALVLSEGGRAIAEKTAPSIASQTGQDGGFIPYNGQYGSLNQSVAEGAYGHWRVSMASYTNPGKGHLAALLAFNNGTLQNDYLYRVKVPGKPQLNTMQTAIDMGGNDITNANNVNAKTANLASGNVSGAPGALKIGDSYYYGDSSSSAIRQNGQLYVQHHNGSPAGIDTGAVTANGNVSSTGSMTANGNVAAKGTVQGGYVGSYGNIDAGGSITGGYVASRGDIKANGSLRTDNSIFFNNHYVAPGWGCGQDGELTGSRYGGGAMLVCKNGSWHKAGAGGGINTGDPGTYSDGHVYTGNTYNGRLGVCYVSKVTEENCGGQGICRTTTTPAHATKGPIYWGSISVPNGMYAYGYTGWYTPGTGYTSYNFPCGGGVYWTE